MFRNSEALKMSQIFFFKLCVWLFFDLTWISIFDAAELKTLSHQLLVNCSLASCPTPALSNLSFGLIAVEIPSSFLPRPLPNWLNSFVKTMQKKFLKYTRNCLETSSFYVSTDMLIKLVTIRTFQQSNNQFITWLMNSFE